MNGCWRRWRRIAEEILGCNTRANLADVDRILRARKAAELMDAGVTIYLPETVVIDPEVDVGPDTVIEPGVQLLGETRIGARCTIQTGSVLHDVRVDDDVTVGRALRGDCEPVAFEVALSGRFRVCGRGLIFVPARIWEISSR